MSDKLPSLDELEEQYLEGTLPDQLAYEYFNNERIAIIHRDELHKNVILNNLYDTKSNNKFLTIKTRA
jgi:hypothetical protein